MYKLIVAISCVSGLASIAMGQDRAIEAPPITVLPIAEFELPEGRDGFRAVALDLPNVYATDSLGGVYAFKIDPQRRSQTVREHEYVETKTDGNAIDILGDSLLLPKRGQLIRFAIKDLARAVPASVLGEAGKWPTRAIVRGQSQLFVLDPYRVSSFQLDGAAADPVFVSAFESGELWWCGCVRDGFIYASVTRPSDGFKGVAVLEIGADGKLHRRGELKSDGMVVGVHAVANRQLILVGDLNANRVAMVDASDPDRLLQTRRLEFPTTRASVIARIHDQDVLVTGLAGAVVEAQGLIPVEYPFHTAGALDSACYFGDVQSEWVGLPADRVIHVVRIVPNE